jgi:hypothetical protein
VMSQKTRSRNVSFRKHLTKESLYE